MKKNILFSFVMVIFLTNGCMTHKDISEGDFRRDTLPAEKNSEEKTVVTKEQNDKKKQGDSLQLKLLQIDSSLRELRGHIEVLEKKYQDQDEQIKTLLTAQEKKAKEQVTPSQEKQNSPAEANNEDFFTKAEDFFKKENWRSAIIHYEKYREHKGKKDPLYKKATFQIGLCFKELKMETESNVFFREIINSYPQSPEAKQAKEFLAEKKP